MRRCTGEYPASSDSASLRRGPRPAPHFSRTVEFGPPRPDRRPGADHHAGGVRVARDLDRHADRRRRTRRARTLRLGLLGLLPRVAHRHRRRWRRDRSGRAGHPVRPRARVVRHRPARRRPGPVDADPGRRPVPAGPRCRDDPTDRLRRDRAQPARIAPAADVRDVVNGLGPARRDRSGDRRDGRRHGRLALRIPRAAAADRAGRGADARGPAGSRRTAAS